ncbi:MULTISPECIES: SMI1/KNR4 family protein [Bacillus]|uniref:SMI1/KNR4 family protein n=1 Tax=Bacillus TaxID=1386 RepID=UPI000653D3D3|nr:MULTISPECIES: SMI1/KNR4 family protein [Bacillus subtilis group]KRT87384.1 spore coat protein [Bacillus paralicheniformis]MDE1362880.1 SMI1/KNR4 family protein [Bacillus paralicheniformis]MDE1398198.1 SMI1/KNR4 family protein [Bacillus licheniformis]MDE1421288.1 SMI1/KNR4 family protein [Bacillus licheniformis]MDE1457015.1 SMI1/KNR4 family protein [Bacillus licheniformis]
MNTQISMMINEYEEQGDFFGAVPDEDISRAEEKLGCEFPRKYKEFVKAYGSGGICGGEVLGIEGDGYASVVEATERFRNFGLPEKYLVIENVDEFVYCLNTEENHCVIRWDDISKKEIERYSSFDEYLQDSFQEAIDNWE